jgi:hypothetical protein
MRQDDPGRPLIIAVGISFRLEELHLLENIALSELLGPRLGLEYRLGQDGSNAERAIGRIRVNRLVDRHAITPSPCQLGLKINWLQKLGVGDSSDPLIALDDQAT